MQAKFANLVGCPPPATLLEGKFSIAFCVALALCGEPTLPGKFSTERRADPPICDLMGKTGLRIEEDIGRHGASMNIVLEDGETLKTTVAFSCGNPENPVGWDDLKGKFDGLVRPVTGQQTADLYDVLRAIDEPGVLAHIFAMLGPR